MVETVYNDTPFPARMGIPIPHILADPFDFMDLRSVEREGETARPDVW